MRFVLIPTAVLFCLFASAPAYCEPGIRAGEHAADMEQKKAEASAAEHWDKGAAAHEARRDGTAVIEFAASEKSTWDAIDAEAAAIEKEKSSPPIYRTPQSIDKVHEAPVYNKADPNMAHSGGMEARVNY